MNLLDALAFVSVKSASFQLVVRHDLQRLGLQLDLDRLLDAPQDPRLRRKVPLHRLLNLQVQDRVALVPGVVPRYQPRKDRVGSETIVRVYRLDRDLGAQAAVAIEVGALRAR